MRYAVEKRFRNEDKYVLVAETSDIEVARDFEAASWREDVDHVRIRELAAETSDLDEPRDDARELEAAR